MTPSATGVTVSGSAAERRGDDGTVVSSGQDPEGSPRPGRTNSGSASARHGANRTIRDLAGAISNVLLLTIVSSVALHDLVRRPHAPRR